MSKRGKSKELLTSVRSRSRFSKTHTFEDVKKPLRRESDTLALSGAVNEWCKNVKSHIKKEARKEKERCLKEKLYEISDSSDEDFEESVFSNIANSVDSIPQASKHAKISNNTPSTSVVTSNTDFVDDLLKTNEVLNGSFLKTYDELCKETDQLLASSLELFNENSSTNSKDSSVFVCTDKDPMKSSLQESLPPNESVSHNSETKPGHVCPICLEALGGELKAWSTFCGHVFCKNCIENWITSQKNCPTCRKRLTVKKIHQLFLN